MTPPGPRTFLLPLLALCVGSGCAALIYEVVWFQYLELVIGSSTISLGILLGTFMGGMCLGSLLLSRLVSLRMHPLRLYAALELGIGLIGAVLFFAMPGLGGLYLEWAGSGLAGMLIRGAVAGVCLLPPALLMGATLPALSRSLEPAAGDVAWLGFFYGGNILGGVIGSLLAGFYLLRVHDTATATFSAVALNTLIALCSFCLAGVSRAATPPARADRMRTSRAAVWPAYLAVGLSGMTALAAEVIWTRNLSLVFGGTVYTFSLILAVFLLGLGIGSALGSALGRGLARPGLALAVCQLLQCGAIAWSAFIISRSLPFWPVDPAISNEPWLHAQVDLVRTLWAVLPATLLWGASFPLALAAAVVPGEDPARWTGGIYAANTLGAIAGSLGASLLFVPLLGTRHSQQLLIGISAFAGTLLLWPAPAAGGGPLRLRYRFVGMVVPLLAVGGAVLLAGSVPDLPPRLVEYGRFAAILGRRNETLYVGEGLNASVAVSRSPEGILSYHNAGKVQASSDPADMRLQRMLGHLTTLLPERPRSVLVIGCGAGVTAGAASLDPATESVTVVELEPLVPRVVSTYFWQQNHDVIRNPKVRVLVDDGRHFLFTTRQRFDAITSDPLDPWVKGTAALYSREFFQEARRHLEPGGVMTQFVQLYESSEEAVQSQIATFFDVFPDGAIWANSPMGEGYDLVLVGSATPLRIDADRLQQRLDRVDYARVAQSIRDAGFDSSVELLSTYAGRAADLKEWLRDASINRDRNLRLQYLAGLRLDLYKGNEIFDHLLAFRRFPADLFTGSPATLQALQDGIRGAPKE